MIELTKRQKEVLELVSQGLTSKEIGEILFISYKTVERHRADLLVIYQAKNTVQLINKSRN